MKRLKQSLKWAAGTVAFLAVCAVLGVASFLIYDHQNPPPLDGSANISQEVVDADGRLLRAFVNKNGRWRLPARLEDIDGEFIKLLIAYEDQRFYNHPGVDVLALMRAAGQFITNGRIVSGGSTITMQLARLLEPRSRRSLLSKFHQIIRALQIERRLSKIEILERYLSRAPYGGNLEGVRAASWAWFGREPKKLALHQSALLVALPQSPERRRPDRYGSRAKNARNAVLTRAANAGVIAPGEIGRAGNRPVHQLRRALPAHASHLAERLVKSNPDKARISVTLKRQHQLTLEAAAKDAVRNAGPGVSVAVLLADARTGAILAQVGAPDHLDAGRNGFVDMTIASRSPGSTLKPFIYGLALENGLIKPETLINDTPANFAGYRPQNFDLQYQGEVSIRKALQLSLNVPAVLLLEAVGPNRLLAAFNRAGVKVSIPGAKTSGLAIGLGGLGISLKELVQLYTTFANGGRPSQLHHQTPSTDEVARAQPPPMLQPSAAWQVSDILAGVSPPQGVSPLPIAYKTGTSYGYRDAWSVGFDGRYVLGVWVGRADNGAVPGITGRLTAAPVLFDAFARLGITWTPFPPAPDGATVIAHHQLPVTLRHFKGKNRLRFAAQVPEPPPQIVYPPKGARVELTKTTNGTNFPLVMKLQDGRPPFYWLANGKPISRSARKRTAMWQPDGNGFSKLTVIDATGRAASVDVFVNMIE